MRCEIDAGGWQDVSSLVYQREGTSPPVTLVRGRADESSQANPGSGTWEWNNRDGRFSPKNPVSPYYGLLGRNTPVRWSVPAQHNYLRIETDNASGASCPDSSGLHITGDIDIRIDLKLTSYAGSVLFAKWGASGEFGWLLQTNPDGTLKFFWSTTGSNFPSAQSTAPLPATGRQALRVTLAVSSGTVTFYTGPAGGADGSTWTQLGSAVVTGSTSVFATTAAIGVGDYASGTGGMYGSVYEFELRSGIAGTVKAHPVFSSQTAGTTSFTDAESNTWTLFGTAEISDRDYRWHGQMSAQPPVWDVTGNDMAVKATAGGPLRLINQGNAPLMSPIKRAVTLLSGAAAPVAYWPMEDAAGASAFGSATGGQPMYFSGAPNLASNSDFACSNALPVVNSAAFSGAVSYSGTWTDNQVLFLLEIPSAAEADEAVISAVYTTGTVALLTLRYRTAGAGSLELFGFSSGGTQLFDSTAVTFPGGINGTQMLIAVALQNAGGGNITWHLDGWAAGAASPTGLSGSISGTVGAVTRVALNRDGTLTQTVLGHCAVLAAYQQLYNLFTATTPNGVPTGALNGWAGEPAATRFARLAGENGYAARIIGAPAPSAAMGAQAIDTLANLLQACEDADRGQIFEPRQALALGYRTLASMYSQSPKLTLNYPASEPGGADGNPDDSGLDPTYDDLLTRNDETLTRTAGSGSDGGTYQFQLNDGSAMSITGVGDYADTKSVNVQYDAQLPNVAGWMVHVGTVDEARWPLIPVNLARSEMAALYYDALDTDIGDHVQITNAPDLVVYDPVDQLAFQVTEQLGGFHYAMAFNAVPELPYEVAVAGTARADTAGSQLATSYSSSATSFSVDVTAGNLWITTSAFSSMFPFDINVAGERITVTAISGSSSPQTFTVTRSVNGVSKAQAADAPVALWNTPVAAL